jgi:hypothetical protein
MTNLLIYKSVLLCCNQLAQETSIWQKLTENAVSGLITLIGLGIAAYLAYRYALKQKRKETFIGLEKIKYEKKLNALENCWKLLAYTTDTENEKSVFKWELSQNKEKTYFLIKANAEEFLKSLAVFFYGSGLGVYLSKEIKEKIFEYRSILYGFLLKESHNTLPTILIQNNEMANKMIALHQELILQLKKETDIIDKLEQEK